MTKEYKRKFLVDGNTTIRCRDICKSYPEPCRKGKGMYMPYEKRLPYCPHKDRVDKPRKYIVSETIEGEWQCSCPVWKFRRRECHHIRQAQADPAKYQIAKEHTGRTIETLRKVFE